VKFFWLLFLPGLWLSAQDYGSIDNKLQGEDTMQNTNSEIVPDAYFPFGEPLKLVKQRDRSPKTVFVLGVYASAVHAKWLSPKGKVLCRALAVASEPEIFWKGDNAIEIISQITVPQEAGYLEPAEDRFNGPSGRALDELYLEPLGLSRSNVWLCDLVPHSLMNKVQKEAIKNRYNQKREEHGLKEASIKEKPKNLTDENRRNEILAELEESQAKTIILLGNEPIKWFLSHVSDCKKTQLSEFGDETYGDPVLVNINGKEYTVIPLTHMRQGGSLGWHNVKWERLHKNWVERERNKRK
jgi:uracil-DNA glycosylase